MYYVINMLRKRNIKKFLKENPSQSPLHKIEDSDWANTVTILANSTKKWERAVRVKNASPAEFAKYKGHKNYPEMIAKKYKPVKEQFTKSEGKKKIYCTTLLSEEGHALFCEEEKK